MEDSTITMPQSRAAPELLTRDEVSKMLHCSLSYVDSHIPDLPRIKIGRKVMYDKDDVVAWILKHKVDGRGVKKCISKTTLLQNSTK